MPTTPLSISCPVCGALAGRRCVNTSKFSHVHTERVEKLACMNRHPAYIGKRIDSIYEHRKRPTAYDYLRIAVHVMFGMIVPCRCFFCVNHEQTVRDNFFRFDDDGPNQNRLF